LKSISFLKGDVLLTEVRITGWTIHCIFRAVLISGAIVPLQGASIEALLANLEVTSVH
jgi:hypothetical protein